MTAIDDLPPLREAIRRHGLSAKKSLGQNFLLDLNLTTRIARAGGPLDGVTVVEIGPGPGGLTRALIAQGASRVIAVERDDRATAALGEIAAHYPGKLTVIEGDALEIDWRRAPVPPPSPIVGEGWGGGSGDCGIAVPHSPTPTPNPSPQGEGVKNAARIVANLPYNIATALLVRWLSIEPWPPWYDSLVLMFQREVADRIVAPPGTKQYGRLAVLAGWRTEAKIMFDVAPSAFVPPPKVTSSVVQLVPRIAPLPCSRATLERVTTAAFGQRRKMLRQSLRALGSDPQSILAAAGIDPTARAEDVTVERFVALANALDAGR
jgi:16S rRNA (adenine1518-N6/adenine1519-N6)-dimethyltransferase